MCLFCLKSLERNLLLQRTQNCVSPSWHVLRATSTQGIRTRKRPQVHCQDHVNTTYVMAPAGVKRRLQSLPGQKGALKSI